MTGRQLIDRVREIGRSRGIVVRIDTMKGKVSHILLLYGDSHRTVVNAMRFVYPARLRRTGPDEIVVSFRDLPECLTSGADETEALAEAADALDVAIAGRIAYPPANGDPIPVPSARRTDEHDIAVPADTAAKAALVRALRESRLSRNDGAGA